MWDPEEVVAGGDGVEQWLRHGQGSSELVGLNHKNPR